MISKLPILYSFKRCPYAMRARLALVHRKIPVIIREIDLRNKAVEFLKTSPKGTVPVLILASDKVIDESIDIVNFAWPEEEGSSEIANLLDTLHSIVIPALMRFKYSDRYEDVNIAEEQEKICEYFFELDGLLSNSTYLLTNTLGKADLLILPFIRQIFKIDQTWFDAQPYKYLKNWFHTFLHSDLHKIIMQKYPVWKPEQEGFVLSWE